MRALRVRAEYGLLQQGDWQAHQLQAEKVQEVGKCMHMNFLQSYREKILLKSNLNICDAFTESRMQCTRSTEEEGGVRVGSILIVAERK